MMMTSNRGVYFEMISSHPEVIYSRLSDRCEHNKYKPW